MGATGGNCVPPWRLFFSFKKAQALSTLSSIFAPTKTVLDIMRSSSRDSELISALQALAMKSPKLVHSSTYAAPNDPTIDVTSWKMNEFKYYDVPCPFPTLARGLFSTKEKDKDQYRIVVRGYDKFFNIGEVPWTTVSDILDVRDH
jgi:tRNA splicing ligase